MPGEISINAQTKTIADLFSGSLCYLTPEYQRPYIWTDDQAKQLYADVAALTNNPKDLHFTGVILLQNTEPAGYVEKFKIIDGQQRLTTLQLFIAALRERRQELEGTSSAEADTLKSLYMHNQHGVPPDQPSLAYKISHSNDSDAKIFRLLVNLKINLDYETKEQPTKNQLTADLPLDTLETPLGKAYSVFNRKLSQMTDPEHPGQNPECAAPAANHSSNPSPNRRTYRLHHVRPLERGRVEVIHSRPS